MDALFSFLRRKTDFFSGASPEQIQELVMKVINKHSAIAAKDEADKKAAIEKEKKRKEALEKKKKVGGVTASGSIVVSALLTEVQ